MHMRYTYWRICLNRSWSWLCCHTTQLIHKSLSPHDKWSCDTSKLATQLSHPKKSRDILIRFSLHSFVSQIYVFHFVHCCLSDNSSSPIDFMVFGLFLFVSHLSQIEFRANLFRIRRWIKIAYSDYSIVFCHRFLFLSFLLWLRETFCFNFECSNRFLFLINSVIH